MKLHRGLTRKNMVSIHQDIPYKNSLVETRLLSPKSVPQREVYSRGTSLGINVLNPSTIVQERMAVLLAVVTLLRSEFKNCLTPK